MNKRKSEKTIPFTVEAVLDFVASRYHVPIRRLKGAKTLHKNGQAALIDEESILVERDGKDFFEVFRREDGEKEMRQSLLSIIEWGELTSDLEEVSMATLYEILIKHVDLESLSGWVSATSNHDVRVAAASEQKDFWKLWNHLGLKPKATLATSKDHGKISPSFVMMKRLQEARFANLSSDLARALLVLLNGDFLAACGVILQECRSFDWSAVVEDLVTSIGGVEGWMGRAAEVAGGLVFCPIK